MHAIELCAGFSDKSEGTRRKRRIRGVSRYSHNLISVDRIAARSPVNFLEAPDNGTHEISPRMSTATVMANGARKLTVLSSTNPVSAGPMSPAKLPQSFCTPVHNPSKPSVRLRGQLREWSDRQFFEERERSMQRWHILDHRGRGTKY
jgi:hypothetical protein